MARDLERKLEADADRKGLTGERRKRYIGGAWNRIRGKEARSRWRYSDDSRRLGRFFGEIHDLREIKRRPGEIAFRQGERWYHLPKREYHALNMAAIEAEHREAKEAKQQEREATRERAAIADYERALAQEQKAEQRRARRQEQAAAAEQRIVRKFERSQYSDVRAVIRAGGGIRPTYDTTGKQRDRGEYLALPADVRRKGGRLTMDDAARDINAEMPWLGIETPNDLQNFFSRQTDRRYFLMREGARKSA
jgi:hypothetical protein